MSTVISLAALAYDNYAGQFSDISVTNPQYLIVAVGW